MIEGGSHMQPQPGNGRTANGEQPEPAAIPMNGVAASGPGNGQTADEAADSGEAEDIEAATDVNGQGSSSRSAVASSHESRIKGDFEFLWRLRKYLLLLAVLAVGVTYNAGLSPPGGFQMDDKLDRHAGDPLLPLRFFRRYQAFFYCNATAFAASLVLIILLLSRGVASKHVWLRSMQFTMILDLFSLMGAYAAGSCRALRSSVYILVLVCSVFVYVGVHILLFMRVVPQPLKEQVQKTRRLILKKLQRMLNKVPSMCSVSDSDGQRSSRDHKREIEEARKFILMLATFAATITYQAGISPPGGFWGVNDHGHRPATFVLRKHNLLRFNIFTCCNATSFVASLVTVILLLSTELSTHGIRTQALFVCVLVDLLGLIGAYASGSCRDVATSLSVVLIISVVLICVVILVICLHSKTVTVWMDKSLKPAFEKVLSMLSLPGQDDSPRTHQQCTELHCQRNRHQDTQLDSQRTHQQDTELDSQRIHQHDTELDSQGTQQQDTELDSQRTQQQDTELDSQRTQQQDTELDSQRIHQHDTELDSQRIRQKDTELDSQRIRQQDTELDSQRTQQQDTELDSQRIRQQDTELDSQRTQQQATGHVVRDTEVEGGMSNLQFHPADSNLVSTGDVISASASDLNSMEDIMSTTLHQSHDQSEQAATKAVCSSSTNALTTEEVPMYNIETQSACNRQVAIPMALPSSSDGRKSIQGILPLQGLVDQNGASGNRRINADDPAMGCELPDSHGDSTEQNSQPMSNNSTGADDDEVRLEIDRTTNDQATRHQRSIYCSCRNPDDARLKKSRTYLLLLAILAVSLTYQAGLNPPGGFWTSNATKHSAGDPILGDSGGFWTSNGTKHSAGDPILEDSYHKRYLAFFYFNATAFAASLVMIVMLLSSKMSNKVIKRRALQTAMITDLLALMGAFVVGSCREKTKSIYISVVIFIVVLYVPLHVLVFRHNGWLKDCVAQRMKFAQPKSLQTDNELRDANAKDLERRRNLLFILAILAATVTYQAGLNPPGGIWPDENSKGGTPGNPVLQDSHPDRYDVFYYSNAVSFVSSVSVIILLVNRESCEDGIKSYAIRMCLVAGLLGLLVAYSAGTCRKARPVIYLIVIASAVLTCLVIQFLILSSTQDALDGPLTWLRKWLRKILHVESDSETPLDSSDEEKKESNSQGSGPHTSEKKEKKRQKYLMLLSVLAASIAYQAGLNPPGGFWPDDTPGGYKAGNPVLKDIHLWRYMVFFVFNSISFMSSIAVVMLLLSKSVRQRKVPLQALHFIMILDLLALMTAYAAGSCRKFRTSIFILVVVCCVLVYLVVVIILSSGIARWLKKQKRKVTSLLEPSPVAATSA
ncbi:uncharacterized protein LOC123412097 [Hordeum vulgare subsp. vulgare]|uniref:PGG domain-containing protein n=1 Tax=Hordeum vulgare subsp. vulgare TaxID=112509 RepID=A0A8I6YM64_HORVV|nr:uncharacterized protein LOC123412097 [Hordeum vulgare subsp. vulgare]